MGREGKMGKTPHDITHSMNINIVSNKGQNNDDSFKNKMQIPNKPAYNDNIVTHKQYYIEESNFLSH